MRLWINKKSLWTESGCEMRNLRPLFPRLLFYWPFAPLGRIRFLVQMTGHPVGHFGGNLSCTLSTSSLLLFLLVFCLLLPVWVTVEFYLLKQDSEVPSPHLLQVLFLPLFACGFVQWTASFQDFTAPAQGRAKASLDHGCGHDLGWALI